jgi:hypothetical protein
MPYNITHFIGTPLTTVDDGTLDTTTDLKLVGKNYAGYGTIQNDNYVYLLENFAGTTAPPKKIPGQVWFDSGNSKLKFWDGNTWRTTGGAAAQDLQPVGQTVGDFWYKTDTKQLFAFNGDSTVTLIGPQAVTGAGQAGLQTVNVIGTDTLTHTIILGYVNNVVSFVMSSDTFTLDASVNAVSGFTAIHQGITLRDSQTGITSSGYRLWGTASNAESLNGVLGSDYALKADPTFTGTSHFSDLGITVGTTSNDLKMFIDTTSGRIATIQNVASPIITFKVKDGSQTRTPLVLNALNALPGTTLAYDLGSSTTRWNNIWVGTVNATTLNGNLVGNLAGTSDKSDKLLYNGNYVSAVSTATANTIVARDSNASTALKSLTVETVNATTSVTSPTFYGALSGTATRANTVLYDYTGGVAGTNYVSATDANVNNSLVARDTFGNFAANIITGTATRARYADLAERYESDADYEPGTVVVFGGEKEITTTNSYADTRVAGAVSTAPAYLMNDVSNNPPIALRGKIPVKVIGPVSKGDPLVTSSTPGYAEVADLSVVSALAVFAKSLEDKGNSEPGIVVAVIL